MSLLAKSFASARLPPFNLASKLPQIFLNDLSPRGNWQKGDCFLMAGPLSWRTVTLRGPSCEFPRVRGGPAAFPVTDCAGAALSVRGSNIYSILIACAFMGITVI